MRPLSFVLVGSGWRAMFYSFIARQYPELFELKYILCRTEEKAERIRRSPGSWNNAPVTTSVEECQACNPDFVVVAVTKGASFHVIKEWLQKGYAVLAETPAAATEEQLEELWALRRQGARLQIAEQYIRYPLVAAGLQAVKQGLLGDPYAVELSLAHDYHGVSLIRHMLNLGLDIPENQNMGLPAVKLFGKQYITPVLRTNPHYGPNGLVLEYEQLRNQANSVNSMKDAEQTGLIQQVRKRVTMEFEGGKTAFYDFAGVQYRSYIRSRHINVQGQLGEWNDTVLRYVRGRACEEELKPCLNPDYSLLNTEKLREQSQIWKPEVVMDGWQDMYAVASMMLDMGKLIESGRESYPLGEALEDAYLWLLMEKAVENPGQVIISKQHSWQKGI